MPTTVASLTLVLASLGLSASTALADTNLLSNTGGICDAVALFANGTKAATNFGQHLTTYDVTNAAAPVQLGSVKVGGIIWDIDVVGSMAYVSASDTGLVVVSLADPAHPQVVNTVDTDGYATSAAIVGSTLYLSDNFSLKVFSIANPASPTLVSSLPIVGYAYDVAASGTTVCVTQSQGAIRVINAANPAAPSVVGTFTAVDPGSIAMSGNYLYVPDSIFGLKIVNVANPAAPTLVATCPCDGKDLWNVAIAGTKAYAGGWRDLHVVDVANPLAPVSLGFATSTALSPKRIAVSGTKAFIADYGAFAAWNVGTPSALSQASRIADFGSIADVAILGSLAYVASYSEGLWILDVSNPSSPVRRSHTPIDGWINELTIQGTYLYASVTLNSGESRIFIYNVSSADNPVLVANKAMPDGFDVGYGISKAGNNLFVATYEGLRVLNVANPAAPFWTGFVSVPGGADDVSVEGSVAAVVSDGYALHVLNVANPSAPVLTATTVMYEYLNEVVVKGGIAYVGKSYDSVARFQVTNPAQPVELPVFENIGWNNDLVVNGSTVLVANIYQGVREIDFSSGSGVTVGTYATMHSAEEIAISGNLIAVGENTCGFFLFGTCGGPTDLNCDGSVNAADLSLFLSEWGSTTSAADFNHDGVVNAADLSELLSTWG